MTVESIDEGRIAVVTLTRPEVLNAMSTALSLQLTTALEQLDADRSCRVVVLTGAGDRAFCAGADLKERRGMSPDEWRHQHRVFEHMHWVVRNYRKPIFAAVNGIALGGGVELAMSTDFIVCSSAASFGQPEVSRGIQPGAGGTQLLPRLISRGMALQLLMTGETIAATEAWRLGLVNSVWPPSELMPVVVNIASRIAANSPTAVRQSKRAARMGLDSPLEQGIEIEIECYQRLVDHPDRREGVEAFNEHRTPNFRDEA